MVQIRPTALDLYSGHTAGRISALYVKLQGTEKKYSPLLTEGILENSYRSPNILYFTMNSICEHT